MTTQNIETLRKFYKLPIAYRAWDATHKQFDEVVAANLLQQMHDPYEELDEQLDKRYFLDAWIGTTDRNGVKIFTGDICAIWDERRVDEWVKTDIVRAIEYDEFDLGYSAVTEGGDFCKCTKGNAKQFEVIGNIYQSGWKPIYQQQYL